MRAPYEAELSLAEALLPGPSWSAGHVEEGGQSHLVLVAPDEAVLRMARTPSAAAELPRRTALADALAPHLPFQVPRALSPVWSRPGGLEDDGGKPPAAVVLEFLPGTAHEPRRGDPATLRNIIQALAAVDVAVVAHLLAEPFAYRGPWDADKRERTLAALPPDSRGAAARVLDTIAGFADVEPGLVHGDLAGHNMHWHGRNLVGVLDWDYAAAWDPALNTAYLGMWHGRDLVPLIARNAEEARRATVWDGAIALELVYNASTRTDAPNWRRLFKKVLPRIEAASRA